MSGVGTGPSGPISQRCALWRRAVSGNTVTVQMVGTLFLCIVAFSGSELLAQAEHLLADMLLNPSIVGHLLHLEGCGQSAPLRYGNELDITFSLTESVARNVLSFPSVEAP
jgi:hypothetical protein